MNSGYIKQNRKSIRLPNYDYAQEGAYFLTICTYNSQHLFGWIDERGMILNQFGKIVDNEWLRTPEMRPNLELGEFVIMPNRMHGIIIINNISRTDTELRARTKEAFGQPVPGSIPTIIRSYKATCTKQIN